jgi:hypothetical protein
MPPAPGEMALSPAANAVAGGSVTAMQRHSSAADNRFFIFLPPLYSYPISSKPSLPLQYFNNHSLCKQTIGSTIQLKSIAINFSNIRKPLLLYPAYCTLVQYAPEKARRTPDIP